MKIHPRQWGRYGLDFGLLAAVCLLLACAGPAGTAGGVSQTAQQYSTSSTVRPLAGPSTEPSPSASPRGAADGDINDWDRTPLVLLALVAAGVPLVAIAALRRRSRSRTTKP